MAQRILGIDPGTIQFGYGLLEADRGEGSYLTAGVIKAPRSLKIGERLHRIHTELLTLIETWRPDVVAVEEPFVPPEVAERGGARTSMHSAIAVGQAQAIALLAAAKHGLRVYGYPPTQVKSAVSGYGQGSKAQVAAMVGLLLGLQKPPEPVDATDALAVAICHLQHERLNTMV
ncbi:MAG: crossover junction endodeoxyribonuclease RuvC [Chloroflexota bacterium]|nr:crossover junction endodeoxyribonuclease RuvC [Chloroflexota bacterium]